MVYEAKKTIDDLDGNGFLKTCALSMELEQLFALGIMGETVFNINS